MIHHVGVVQDGDIAVISLNRPPSNALNLAILQQLETQLRASLEAPAIRGVLLRGENGSFSTGWDLTEFYQAAPPPTFNAIADLMEQSDKPIVAALSGRVISAGLELALYAHARVAQSNTIFGLPEVSVGLIPGNGATQRLPRLLDARGSIELQTSGRLYDAKAEQFHPLFDQITDTAPEGAAKQLLKTLMTEGLPPSIRDRIPGLSDPDDFQATIQEFRENAATPGSARHDIIDCIEASQLLPFEQGLTFEYSRFEDRYTRAETRARVHGYIARNQAAQLPAAVVKKAIPVRRIAVIGGSEKAVNLASMALRTDRQVAVWAGTKKDNQTLLQNLDAHLNQTKPFGQGNVTDWKARLNIDHSGEAISRADLVLDAGDLTPDHPFQTQPEAVWLVAQRPGRTLDRDAVGARTGRTLGLKHLIPGSRFAELGVPNGATNTTVATAHAALRSMGTNVIVTAQSSVGITDTLFATICRATMHMLEAGLSPQHIRRATRALGLTRSPFLLIDGLGAYQCLQDLKLVFKAQSASLSPLRLLSDRLSDLSENDESVAHGTLAFVSAIQSPAPIAQDLEDWLKEWRDERLTPLPLWPGVDPAVAIHAALVNAACHLGSSNSAQRMSDIDLAAEHGLMMDAAKGGPLIQADTNGTLPLARAMSALAGLDATLWKPHPKFTQMVQNGERFFNAAGSA